MSAVVGYVVGIGGLLAVALLVFRFVSLRITGVSALGAFEGTWVMSREFRVAIVAALAGWLIGLAVASERGSDWNGSLLLSLSGALLFVALHWYIDRSSRSVLLYALTLFALPLAAAVVVTI